MDTAELCEHVSAVLEEERDVGIERLAVVVGRKLLSGGVPFTNAHVLDATGFPSWKQFLESQCPFAKIEQEGARCTVKWRLDSSEVEAALCEALRQAGGPLPVHELRRRIRVRITDTELLRFAESISGVIVENQEVRLVFYEVSLSGKWDGSGFSEWLALVPTSLRGVEKDSIVEVTVQAGCYPLVAVRTKDGCIEHYSRRDLPRLTQCDITAVRGYLREKWNSPYVPCAFDTRVCIPGTLHGVLGIPVPSSQDSAPCGFTIRMSRDITGLAAQLVLDPPSLLVAGPPRIGKTTLLRDICGYLGQRNKVVVVDTFGEICGIDMALPPSLGSVVRVSVPEKEAFQERVMLQSVKTHAPDILVVDEINTWAEVHAVRNIERAGVCVVAGARAVSLTRLVNKKMFARHGVPWKCALDMPAGKPPVMVMDIDAYTRPVPESPALT